MNKNNHWHPNKLIILITRHGTIKRTQTHNNTMITIQQQYQSTKHHLTQPQTHTHITQHRTNMAPQANMQQHTYTTHNSKHLSIPNHNRSTPQHTNDMYTHYHKRSHKRHTHIDRNYITIINHPIITQQRTTIQHNQTIQTYKHTPNQNKKQKHKQHHDAHTHN